MVSAFLNTVKIPELRRRILFTLAVIVIVRLGAAITTPGVNQGVLQEWFRISLSQRTGGGLAALFNLFSGGGLENCAVFSLGLMPYISASIMMQLVSAGNSPPWPGGGGGGWGGKNTEVGWLCGGGVCIFS